jgi:hypothetical protein
MDLREFSDDAFTIKFGGPRSEVDVYTLTEALTGLADALQEINALVNPEVELEIIFEHTAEGSFLAKIRTSKRARAVFARVSEALIVGLLVNYIYSELMYEKPTYTVEGDKLVVVTSQEKLIFQKSVFDNQEKVAASPSVAKGVKRAIEAVHQDGEVVSLGIIPGEDVHARPAIDIPRSEFSGVISKLNYALDRSVRDILPERTLNVLTTQQITERTTVGIIKAVLRRSKRKWQFSWQGIEISAAILDPTFFDRLAARQIAIAQGDSLDVDLRITQSFDPDIQIWMNTHYEVIRVHGLVEGPKQSSFGLDA